jgi:hypothetical protein
MHGMDLLLKAQTGVNFVLLARSTSIEKIACTALPVTSQPWPLEDAIGSSREV